MTWVPRLSFTLFPGTCILCGSSSNRTIDLCRDCERDLPVSGFKCRRCSLPLARPGTCVDCTFEPPPFESIFTPFLYTYPIDQMLVAFKHGARLEGRVLGDVTAQRVVAELKHLPDVLVPVPMTAKKLRDRGFNQATDIARRISASTQVPIDERLVHRIRDNLAQKTLSARARRQNLSGAFEGSRQARGLAIAIVDDVVTTSGTVAELSRTLLNAGAARVTVIAIARTPRGPH